MSRYAISLGTLFAMSTFGAGALVLVACAGKVIGSGGPLQTVSASEINQPVVACGGGYAHPNVCCEAGAGKTSSCGVFPGAPFQSCGSGFSTYPDPRSCCSLDGSGDCIAPPPSPPPTPVPGCSYACPAGQYEPAGSPGTCCFDDGSTTVCSVSSSGGGVSGCGSCACACPAGGPCPPCDCPPEPSCVPPSPPSPPTCACPACPVGAPCPLCICDADAGPGPSPPPVPVCNACPPGWQVPAGEPLLCCNDSGGAIECPADSTP